MAIRPQLEDEATLTDFLIAFLCSARSSMAFHRIMRERVLARKKEGTVSATLSRLKRKGFLELKEGKWDSTQAGRVYHKNRERSSFISSPFPKQAPDHLVVGFDIPESKRRIRNWLRTQLKIFGYRMIQKSLWIGPGPMPQEFNKRISELEIKDNLKIFKLSVRH